MKQSIGKIESMKEAQLPSNDTPAMIGHLTIQNKDVFLAGGPAKEQMMYSALLLRKQSITRRV